MDLEES